jgi:hypothetical protein
LIKKYNQSVGITTTLIHLIMKYEHLPTPIVELMEVLVKEYEHPQFVGDFIR